MRVMQLSKPASIDGAPLTEVDIAEPVPGPDELVIDVAACAVCRTDLQIVEGALAARALPVVPGHQVVGRVRAVGAQVANWAVGDRAGIGWLASACGTCRFCGDGLENLCEAATFTGWDRDGGYAEQIVVRADFALAMPVGPTDLELAPLLCGGVIGYRALKVSGIKPGGRLGLYGFGASASLAIQVAVHWGCEVFVATRSKAEQARARRLGAVWAGDYRTEVPTRLDAAVTFAPVGDIVVAALSALAPGGVVSINAIHLDHIPEFDYDLLWRERQLRSVANYTRADASSFLELAAELPVRTAIQEYRLSEAGAALYDVSRGTTRGTAVLVM
ncbi:MAG: zinc-dependent alcohol dehydrogenase family protein [Acidimicrobiia bacterium]|nr:zinc-dependent alcohol dehydrogenase family protein [Acidimicrobiia bacterium]NNJ47187.1 zinc-dependent alcohol dehydrogenase family protein [Acidimicrobiia bacterium]